MDKTVAGAGAGVAAGLIVGIVSSALYLLNIASLCLVAIGGGMFNRAITPPGFTVEYFLGWSSHLAMSMILGAIIISLLYYTGKDYGLFKGAMFGVGVWYVAIAIISPLAGYTPNPADAVGIMFLFGYHLLFGLLTAALILRYGKLETLRE